MLGALDSYEIDRNKWTEILIKQVLIDGVFRYMVKIGSEYIIDEVTSPNTQTNMDLHIGASTGYANYLRTRFFYVKPGNFNLVNRYRSKRPKVDASLFDSPLSHTRRSDASEKKRKK